MPKIVHIADVHWRGLTRHQEYYSIFNDFFEKCKNIKPDIIYIGGDIVHNKTQGISPELIQALTWWFRGMADIAEVHVALGNHDGILLNKDRQDTITPIIDAINHPRIKLYKKSGVYSLGERFPDFNWCVFSCFDEDAWNSVKPEKDKVNIALFHGSVRASLTDSDWVLDGDANLDFFDDYDFALLGDIHKRQFLNDKKTIAYCGSTIQQNYGEDIEKGFLLWDIRGKDDFDVEFIQLEPYSPFITIDWVGSTKETIDTVLTLPKRSRIRIRHKETIPHLEVKHLINTITEKIEASEVVFKDERDFSNSTTTFDNQITNNLNLFDPSTHIKLFKEFYKDKNIKEDEWALLESLVIEKAKAASKTEGCTRNVKWSLLGMEFDNTFGYGKNNKIDFTNLSGITGIFGRNTTGKSSIIGTILYTLFNTTDRGPIKNLHVINTRKDYCRSSIDLLYKGEKLRIERQTVRNKAKKTQDESGITHLNFYRVDEENNPISDLSAEQRRDTEKIVREKLGSAEDFLLTSVATQGDINSFISERSTARKKILTNFLGLNIFDTMFDSAKEESNQIKNSLKNMPSKEWDHIISEKRKEKKELAKTVKALEAEIKSLRKQENKISLELSKKDVSNVVTQHDVDSQSAIVSKIENDIKSAKENLKSLSSKKENLLLNKKTFKENNDAIDIEWVKQKIKEKNDLEKTIIDLTHKAKSEKEKLERMNKAIELLKEVPCGDLFPTCKFISSSHKEKDHVETQKALVDSLIETLKVNKTIYDLLSKENYEKVQETYHKNQQESFKVDNELLSIDKEIYKNENIISINEDLLKEENEKLIKLKEVFENTEHDESIQLLKSELQNIQYEISTKDKTRIMNAGVIGRFERDIELLIEEKEKYSVIRKKWKIYEHFMNAVSKRGIPLKITMTQLPLINSEIAKILQGVFNFTVEIEADDASNAMDVYINYGDSRRIIEVASGMEKMVASLAIRVALINISSLPKPDIFIIDEGFGVLDDVNVESINRLLVSLKKWFKNILIITHVDAIKDIADNIVEINKNEHDSYVVYE